MGKKHQDEHVNHERWLVSYADFITLLFAFFVVMYSQVKDNKATPKQISEGVENALNHSSSGANVGNFFEKVFINSSASSGSSDNKVPIETGQQGIKEKSSEESQSVKALKKVVAQMFINSRKSDQSKSDSASSAAQINITTGSGDSQQNTLKTEGGTNQTAAGDVFANTDQEVQEVVKQLKNGLVEMQEDIFEEPDLIRIRLYNKLFFSPNSDKLRFENKGILDKIASIIKDLNFPVSVEGHTDDTQPESEIFDSNWELSASRAAKVARYLMVSGPIDKKIIHIVGHADTKPVVPNIDEASRSKNRRTEIVINLRM